MKANHEFHLKTQRQVSCW